MVALIFIGPLHSNAAVPNTYTTHNGNKRDEEGAVYL